VDEYQTSLGDEFDSNRTTIGETLKRARLEKGLELADIARETRIHARTLAAIEADEHDGLPALPFTIGFVKSFARCVGIDPATAAAQFRAETTKTSHNPQPTAPLESLDENRLPSRSVIAASVLGLVVVLGGLLAWSNGAFESAAPAQPAPVVEQITEAPAPLPPTPQPLPSTDPALLPPEADPAFGDPAAVPAATDASGPVVITANEDAWFKVYDNAGGPTVKMGILRAGESYTVPGGRDDLLLWTGKAGALTLSVGGRRLAPLGRADETVKDVSLAPAVLAARAG
jgi:cytoskeleton protein RodZ